MAADLQAIDARAQVIGVDGWSRSRATAPFARARAGSRARNYRIPGLAAVRIALL